MGLESFVKDQMAKREARGRSPAFKAEMARENTEFFDILGKLGENTLDAGVTSILKVPTSVFLNGLKTIYDKKYNTDDYFRDALNLFFGKDGAAHKTIKVATNALHLAGKGTKIGLRQLFKL